jgi:rare lipoprotein A (peptidoglycan hydrolase)
MKQIKVFAIAFIAVLCVPYYAQAQFNQAPSGGAPSGEYFRQEGNASWYGNEFEGRRTASGETFNSSLLTAAHPTLPFGTFLLVTNRNNNRQVTVKVNDRGPFVATRIIDVSRAAAEQLDMIYAGIAPVLIETLHVQGSQPQTYLPPQTAMPPQSFMQQPQPGLPPQATMPPQSYMPPQAALPQQPFMQPQAPLPPQSSYMPPQAALPQQPYMPPEAFMQQPQAPLPQAFMQTPTPLPPQSSFMQPQPGLPPQAAMQRGTSVQPDLGAWLQPQNFMQQPAPQPMFSQQPQTIYTLPPQSPMSPVPPLPPMASVPAPVQPATDPGPIVIVHTPAPMSLPPQMERAQPERLEPMIAPINQQPVAAMLPPVQDTLPEISAARLTPPMDPQPGRMYKLQIGSYSQAQNAVAAYTRLKAAGLSPSYERAGDMYRVVLAGVRGTDVRSATEKLGTAGFGEAIIREE